MIAMTERHAVEKLHGDEGLAFVLVDLENRADIGMVERGRRLSLALEASQGLRIIGNLVGQEFKRDEAMQFDVFSLVNQPHPTTAQFFDDAIMRDDLANHWAEILGLKVGQVNECERVGGDSTKWLVKNLKYTRHGSFE